MADPTYPIAVVVDQALTRAKASNHPQPFASRMAGRRKQPRGHLFGLTNFGVNLTRLAPGAVSSCVTRTPGRTSSSTFCKAARRCTPTKVERRCRRACVLGSGRAPVTSPLINEEVVYLEIGDRMPGDDGIYPTTISGC